MHHHNRTSGDYPSIRGRHIAAAAMFLFDFTKVNDSSQYLLLELHISGIIDARIAFLHSSD
ncbi:hypothetical protein [uncultured Paracoccus sp.]|uniref:hypothetical protein n=1 Tax=uncultured Paracoccus sp. TaxID=189685 RepID=UPI0026159640|nr:hypothetical protein [uncultured Paracoccus sp.]